MKVNELQIGDWIIADGKPHKVSTLRKYPENHTIGCMGKYGEFFDNTDKIIPIPLTAEILKVNGFIIKQEQCYLLDGIFLDNGLDGNAYWWQIGHCPICAINYVHELQHALRLCGLDELANNFKVE